MSCRSGFLALARAGTVLCLLLAALSLSVGESEYPCCTRAAIRNMTSDVLPFVLVGWVNLAALDAVPGRARLMALEALAVDIALLVHALPAVTTGGPPFAFMLAGVAGILILGTLGMAIVPVTAAVRPAADAR